MDKMNYPRGLVKYSTENAVNQHWTQSQTLRHVFRPRVLVYTLILWTIIGLMFYSLAHRPPFKVDVERDRTSLAREVEGGLIENVFRLQIMNASEVPQRVHIQADGLAGLTVATDPDLVVDAAQSRWVVVRLQLPVGSVGPGSHPIHFEIDGQDSKAVVIEKSVFIVPR
jgi:polyferredoxin